MQNKKSIGQLVVTLTELAFLLAGVSGFCLHANCFEWFGKGGELGGLIVPEMCGRVPVGRQKLLLKEQKLNIFIDFIIRALINIYIYVCLYLCLYCDFHIDVTYEEQLSAV